MEDVHAVRDEMFARLDGLPERIRQTITDSLWQAIPTYVVEKGSDLSGANTVLNVQRFADQLVLIQWVYVWGDGVGTFQLGDWSTPTPANAGATPAPPLFFQTGIILSPSDPRRLTLNAAGKMSVLMAGVPLPTMGVLPR